MPQEVLHKLRFWGRKTASLRPEAKTSLTLEEESKRREGKTCSQFLTADCSWALGTLLTSFWKVYHSFNLTFHHTTEELQEDHLLWWCAWSFFREMGKWQWFQVHIVQHWYCINLVFPWLSCLPLFLLSYPPRSQKIWGVFLYASPANNVTLFLLHRNA